MVTLESEASTLLVIAMLETPNQSLSRSKQRRRPDIMSKLFSKHIDM